MTLADHVAAVSAAAERVAAADRAYSAHMQDLLARVQREPATYGTIRNDERQRLERVEAQLTALTSYYMHAERLRLYLERGGR